MRKRFEAQLGSFSSTLHAHCPHPSNPNAIPQSQRFLALVLLPAVRRDIRENKKLHFALFQALRKATYKAAAFYKGLLLPLCSYGSCTLREAVIFSSVLRRTSIPVLHSAAALLRIAGARLGFYRSMMVDMPTQGVVRTNPLREGPRPPSHRNYSPIL